MMSFLFIDLHVFLVIMQVNGLISVATFASLIITVISVNCIGNHPCRVLDWEAWGPCVGVCGFNFQERKRALCCPLTVKPRTVEHCVQYCNTTGGVTERRYCPFCGNGTFQYDSLSCQCNPRFKGKCCQDLVTCADSPCLHGRCGDSSLGFVCHCEETYTGIDCGLQIEEKTASWHTVLAYLFLTLLPICIVSFVTYVCVKCCKRSSKRNKKIDRRPKPIQVGADNNIRELTWERVTPRSYGNDITL